MISRVPAGDDGPVVLFPRVEDRRPHVKAGYGVLRPGTALSEGLVGRDVIASGDGDDLDGAAEGVEVAVAGDHQQGQAA